jgi:hypothetical protein
MLYEICIEGKLGDEWAGWFDGWTVRGQGDGGLPPVTLLTGRVVDQAGLRGILNKLWDLNLTLVSVQRLEKAPRPDPARRLGQFSKLAQSE